MMQSANLYRIQKEDLPRVAHLLADCFLDDPLYLQLIPDQTMRKAILPEYFRCYLNMTHPFTDMLADSPDLQGIITVFDSERPISPMRYLLASSKCAAKTGLLLLRKDRTLGTLKRFLSNRSFLTSKWENKLESGQRVHIDLLAVRPQAQGRGIAKALMGEVLRQADARRAEAVLETHNGKNVALYQRFGFELFEMLASRGKLKQYCMIRG